MDRRQMIDLDKLKKEIDEKLDSASDEELKKFIEDSRETKQVIVMRKDLNMRKGKMIAQGAHASNKIIIDLMETKFIPNEMFDFGFDKFENTLTFRRDSALYNWFSGIFTKIVVYVNSEKELLDVYDKAKEKNILCSLIKDNGKTEFNGVPTYTCCAIGPDYNRRIDEITGELPIL